MTTSSTATQTKPKKPAHLGVDTRERLQRYGTMHDTWDTVINKILDQLEAFERAYGPSQNGQDRP